MQCTTGQDPVVVGQISCNFGVSAHGFGTRLTYLASEAKGTMITAKVMTDKNHSQEVDGGWQLLRKDDFQHEDWHGEVGVIVDGLQ